MELTSFLFDYALPTLISSGIAIGIVKLLGSKLINQLLRKEFEKYKSQLQEKVAVLKTSLSIYAEEQNIANQRIDNQKATAIHQIFSGMCSVSYPVSKIRAGSHFVSHDDLIHIGFYIDYAEEAHAAAQKLYDLLANHAIYFDEYTFGQILEYHSTSSHAIAAFLKIIRENKSIDTAPKDLLKKLEEGRSSLNKLHENALQEKHYQITKKFRQSLGIEKIKT